MEYQSLISGKNKNTISVKNKKNIIRLSPAEIAQRVVKNNLNSRCCLMRA